MKTKLRARCPVCKFDKTFSGRCCDKCKALGYEKLKKESEDREKAKKQELDKLLNNCWATCLLLAVASLNACNSSDVVPQPVTTTTTQSSSSGSSNVSTTTSSSSQPVVYTNFAYVASTGAVINEYVIDPNTGELLDNPVSRTTNSGSTGITEGTCALKMHPNKKFVYASNCKNETIAPFVINSDGTLSPVSGDVLTNPVSINISNVNVKYMAFDSTGANLYVTAFKTTNSTAVADYLMQFSVNTSTGAISLVGTAVSNIPGSDLVANYLTSHSLDTSNAIQASLGIYTYKINQSTGMVDQYDNGSLSAYSAYTEVIPESIVVF